MRCTRRLCLASDAPVRTHLVVVVNEAIELALELLWALDVLHGQELLHGLVESLDALMFVKQPTVKPFQPVIVAVQRRPHERCSVSSSG